MSKFLLGHKVRILSGGFPIDGYRDGDVAFVSAHDGGGYRVTGDKSPNGHSMFFHPEELELAPPTEHPALNLAKAEVVRLNSSYGAMNAGRCTAFHEVLRAFGLEYHAKPVVPQPVEYEFVPVQDAG